MSIGVGPQRPLHYLASLLTRNSKRERSAKWSFPFCHAQAQESHKIRLMQAHEQNNIVLVVAERAFSMSFDLPRMGPTARYATLTRSRRFRALLRLLGLQDRLDDGQATLRQLSQRAAALRAVAPKEDLGPPLAEWGLPWPSGASLGRVGPPLAKGPSEEV